MEGDGDQVPANGSAKNRFAHPGVCVFHFLFKAVAIFYFLLADWLFGVDSFTTNFIVLLVFLSCDFWVVKNVTGRFLVGLRWWNDNSDEGEGWRFERLESGQREIIPSEKNLFWAGLIGNVSIWFIFTLMTLFRPSDWEYLLVCVIALTMGGSNFYGYFKCSREARRLVQEYAQQAVVSATASVINTRVAGASSSLV